jgi:hypothetical protein
VNTYAGDESCVCVGLLKRPGSCVCYCCALLCVALCSMMLVCQDVGTRTCSCHRRVRGAARQHEGTRAKRARGAGTLQALTRDPWALVIPRTLNVADDDGVGQAGSRDQGLGQVTHWVWSLGLQRTTSRTPPTAPMHLVAPFVICAAGGVGRMCIEQGVWGGGSWLGRAACCWAQLCGLLPRAWG